MKYYYNQNNYSGVSYDNPNTAKKETVASGGCGVCSAAMVVNNLAGKELYTIPQMAAFSLKTKARDNSGTNMVTLLNALLKANKGFSYTTTGSEDKLIAHLKKGGMAIANQGDRYNVFSTAGHFVVCVRMVGNNIEVYDPSMYAGKYDRSPRPQRIIKKTDRGCIVSRAEIDKATQDRKLAYYLVSYTKPKTATTKTTTTAPAKKASAKTPIMMYCTTAAGLKFRKEPSTSAQLIGGPEKGVSIIGYGDEVEIVKKERDWYQIKYRGYVGYAYAKYLSLKKPNAKTITIKKGRNLRAGAGLTARVLLTTKANVKAELLVDGYWYKDNYYWSRVKIGAKKYYLAKI